MKKILTFLSFMVLMCPLIFLMGCRHKQKEEAIHWSYEECILQLPTSCQDKVKEVKQLSQPIKNENNNDYIYNFIITLEDGTKFNCFAVVDNNEEVIYVDCDEIYPTSIQGETN